MAPALFRFREPVMVLLLVIGFIAPWNYIAGSSHGSLWLAASTVIARTGWLGLAAATLTITLLGLASLVASAGLRIWGTAYLGSAVMSGTVMQGKQLVVAGPYRYVRNPLYLGTWLLSLATSLLMPAGGAAFFLVSNSGFLFFLIIAEEGFLANHLGEPYLQYRREVPRLLPRFSALAGRPPAQPHWLRAFLNETYPIGFTLCFAIFAWRYNAWLLIRCLLICYGFSLVLRAVNGTAKDTNAA